MLTIIDSDSWAPNHYFSEVDCYLRRNKEKINKVIFSAPQIFTRNSFKVPVVVRIYDMMHSMIHLANLPALFFSFPLSNYTLSYTLLEKIGFWDTNADAVG